MSRRLVDGKMPVPKEGAAKGRRPSKLDLDPDVISKIESAVRIGSPVLTAAALQGISYDAVRQWVIKGYKDPESIYGAFIRAVNKATAEWEIRDLATWDAFSQGRPAQFEMEVVRDEKGRPLINPDDGKPIMQVARDPDGYPIIRSPAILPDWRAAAERLARRKPGIWAKRDRAPVGLESEQLDPVLTFDNKQLETKESGTFEQEVAKAMVKFDDEF